MTTIIDRPRRADATRNHDRVLEAANALFAEMGLEAAVEDVAERAGVGKATVYRSFPTKEHLVAAVAVERLRRFEGLAVIASREPDAWTAMVRLLRTIAELQSSERILVGALQVACVVPEFDEARRATIAALNRVMDRAKKQGTMRLDVTVEDVRILLTGVSKVLAEDQQRDAQVWRRYADLIADALRHTDTPPQTDVDA